MIGVINTAASKIDKEAKSTELAKMIFGEQLSRGEDPTIKASLFLKNELRKLYK